MTQNSRSEPGAQQQPLALVEQIALAVRAGRRAAGLSQRAWAGTLGWSASMVKRVELEAGSMPLHAVERALDHAGFALVVTEIGALVEAPAWELTDLEARDRAGRRFPAHRTVRASRGGPDWWWDQEFMRHSRPLGPQPRWTTGRS